MKLQELIHTLNYQVPFNSAESWDNVGLLIGDETSEITGILTTLDCTEGVVDEALEKDMNTIISHHPLIFKGIKNINQSDGYGAIIRKLIKHDMNLIALHTNLDVHPNGVNAMLANRIQLLDTSILSPNLHHYYKVQVFIPEDSSETFKSKLSELGLAQEGNYESCFFQTTGQGQFKPVGAANPTIGTHDKIEYVEETKIEFMIRSDQKVLAQNAIEKYHPYETPVYDIMQMSKNSNSGLGVIGHLEKALSVEEFVQHVKKQLDMKSVRFIGNLNDKIQNVAIIGGAGIGFEELAQQAGADIFLTGDIKHHEALDAKIAHINMLDINHYSEHVMKEGLIQLLQRWFEDLNVPIEPCKINTDPYYYF
ncbi:Nif3-like dinuclear metal center hexameric protein [Staphylococcus sp. SQ8-PEA]|uniref:GTP cyclohydrolase 1 type 2 homolog n=1 Tax=Staphylococcus marylandisciuri TaxID=2981529 RepID=A0ABT2QR00_9STAP|nr:Nif3-like dinuclear metal center hexameric protein [Staphylococcus marylandisciuri]MCU5746378.1 Nif3-like dinuclear metal center hexameric protein [Staphylococcus marylandisciuri]